MAARSRSLFVNLPVKDLRASVAFFRGLGFDFDDRFRDESCACMVVGDRARVMLLAEYRFADLARRPVADARACTEALLAVSADSRAAVDALADAALAAGASPAGEPVDHGFVYSRGFSDLDGHHWSAVWMSPEAVEHGPPDLVEAAA